MKYFHVLSFVFLLWVVFLFQIFEYIYLYIEFSNRHMFVYHKINESSESKKMHSFQKKFQNKSG